MVRWSTTLVVAVVAAAAAVAAVAAVDNEDGVQWRRWGGGLMVIAAFDSAGNGLQIGDGKGKMAIDTSVGGWQWQVSAFDGGDGQRWVLVFDGGNRRQLWQRWTIEMVFNCSGGGGIQ
jgi:hypothetical protein